jgi:hypothetical protein
MRLLVLALTIVGILTFQNNAYLGPSNSAMNAKVGSNSLNPNQAQPRVSTKPKFLVLDPTTEQMYDDGDYSQFLNKYPTAQNAPQQKISNSNAQSVQNQIPSPANQAVKVGSSPPVFVTNGGAGAVTYTSNGSSLDTLQSFFSDVDSNLDSISKQPTEAQRLQVMNVFGDLKRRLEDMTSELNAKE